MTMLEQARAGDREAMGLLLRRYEPMMFAKVLRLVSNRDDAMEVTQEAMVSIIRRLEDFKGDCKVSTWMTRIAINAAISRLRRRKVRQAASLNQSRAVSDHEGEASTLLQNLCDSRELSAPQRVEKDEMLERLRQSVDALNEPFRSTLVMRDLEQMEYAEIAQLTEVSLGTVKSRLFRARMMLREMMTQMEVTAEHATE